MRFSQNNISHITYLLMLRAVALGLGIVPVICLDFGEDMNLNALT